MLRRTLRTTLSRKRWYDHHDRISSPVLPGGFENVISDAFVCVSAVQAGRALIVGSSLWRNSSLLLVFDVAL